MKCGGLEKERDSRVRDIAVLESKLNMMQHEQDLITKLKNQALGSSHQQVSCSFMYLGKCPRSEVHKKGNAVFGRL